MQISAALRAQAVFRHLPRAVGTAAIVLAATQSTAAQDVLVNGTAEAVAGGDGTTTIAAPPWVASPGFTVVLYGTPAGGFPAASDPGPVDRGLNLFTGGENTSQTSASQLQDLSMLAAPIDASSINCRLSAWLGGWADQEDAASVRAEFLSDSSVVLGTAAIGPVTRNDRANPPGSTNYQTGLFFRQQVMLVPPQTRSVRVTIDMVRVLHSYCNAFADNVSFVLLANGSPFCTGDGSLTDHTTPCPCANSGSLGRGCGHSFDPGGARLFAVGSTLTDDIVLRSELGPPSAFTLFLQHDAPGDAVFHDGVLCAGGAMTRLRGRDAVGGQASFPNSTFANDSTLTLSQRGGVLPGSGARRYYAAFYRNASTTFCPPATANVTNGWIIDW